MIQVLVSTSIFYGKLQVTIVIRLHRNEKTPHLTGIREGFPRTVARDDSMIRLFDDMIPSPRRATRVGTCVVLMPIQTQQYYHYFSSISSGRDAGNTLH